MVTFCRLSLNIGVRRSYTHTSTSTTQNETLADCTATTRSSTTWPKVVNVWPAQNIQHLGFVALILENNTRCPRIQMTLWAWQNLSQYLEVLFLIQQRRCTSLPRPHSFDYLTATKDFIKKLKNYILWWTSRPDPEITSYDHFTDEHRSHVKVVSGTLYRHKTLQLSYTTYDM